MASRLLLSRFSKNVAGLFLRSVEKHPIVVGVRGRKRWHKPVFQTLYHRRIDQGPEPDRHRSEWINWNYDAEIYAFGKRLGEDFQEDTLKTVFTHRSHLEKEQRTRAELELDDESTVQLKDNSDLISKGASLMETYLRAVLRHSYPALPEEGVCKVADYLMTEETLSHVGTNIGMNDLILCQEFPPSATTISDTVKAILGGLNQDQGLERVHLFVKDFILTQLIGEDIAEIWQFVNLMGLLQGVVTQQGKGDVESRMLYETGRNTVLAVYMVGVYSDQDMLGKGYGETVTIAEEMAAKDALKRLFGVTDSRPSLWSIQAESLVKIDLDKRNISVIDYLYPNQLQ